MPRSVATAHALPSGRRIILAHRREVESVDFWTRGLGKDARAVVACTGMDSHEFRYPCDIANFPETYEFPVNYVPSRMKALCDICDGLVGLPADSDIVVHCNQSVHRGPLGAVAIARRLEGASADVFYRQLKAERDVVHHLPTQFDPHDKRDLKLWDTFSWVVLRLSYLLQDQTGKQTDRGLI